MIGEGDGGRPDRPNEPTCVRNEVIRSCHEIRFEYFVTPAIPFANLFQLGTAAAVSMRFLADATSNTR